MILCDLCGSDKTRLILTSKALDGPLVRCSQCGLRYVGTRRSHLTFGTESPLVVAERVRQANRNFQDLKLDEEQRLGSLNSKWRLKIIRDYCQSGRLLEVGCARGDFLNVARDFFAVHGVEPNPELARSASRIAPIHHDVVETMSEGGFDVAASFHVIEHVDSPRRFIQAMAERVRAGGFVVIETPNIRSMPFRIFRGYWRQFIPEHYFFFDPQTMTRLMESCGLKVEEIRSMGKFASVDLILNRLSRFTSIVRPVDALARGLGLSRLTFRINPRDVMLIVASKPEGQPASRSPYDE